MKRTKKRNTWLVTFSVALLFALGVSGTLAYIVTQDTPITNVFQPTEVKCSVQEGSFTNGTSMEKTDVKIHNDGNTDAYIRVAIAANWCDKDGYVIEPFTGTIAYNDSAWVKHGAYYYHKESVGAGQNTEVLINRFTPEAGANGTHLEMNIICQAVQAKPETVVKGVWNVSVDEYGKIQ